MEDFLQPTEVFNFDDARVRRKAAELTVSGSTPEERVEAIARFVREWVRLELRKGVRVARASEVLCFLTGSATDKAVLFTALCRASGIPCRLKLQKLSGAPDRWTALGMMAKIEWQDGHPVNEVLLKGDWIAIDVSLDSESASRLGMMMPPAAGGEASGLDRAVSWVADSLIRVKPETPADEGIPAEILRLVGG